MSESLNFEKVAASSALLVSLGSATYFYQQITALNDQLNEIKGHLSSIIPQIDPNLKQGLHQCIQNVQVLNREIVNLKSLGVPPVSKAIEAKPKTHLRKYVRLTVPQDEESELNTAIAALSEKE